VGRGPAQIAAITDSKCRRATNADQQIQVIDGALNCVYDIRRRDGVRPGGYALPSGGTHRML
jgi:hypothetical protein